MDIRSKIKILVVSSKYPPEYAGSALRAHNTYKRLRRKFGVNFQVIAGSVTSDQSLEYCFEDVWVNRIAQRDIQLPFSSQISDFKLGKIIIHLLEKITWRLNRWQVTLPVLAKLIQ